MLMQLNNNLVHQRMRCFMAYNASSCFGINYIIYDLLSASCPILLEFEAFFLLKTPDDVNISDLSPSPAVNDLFTLIQQFSCCVFIPYVMRLIVYSLPKNFRYGFILWHTEHHLFEGKNLPFFTCISSACRKASPSACHSFRSSGTATCAGDSYITL